MILQNADGSFNFDTENVKHTETGDKVMSIVLENVTIDYYVLTFILWNVCCCYRSTPGMNLASHGILSSRQCPQHMKSVGLSVLEYISVYLQRYSGV